MSNKIAKMETREFETNEGVLHAIMCAVNVYEEALLEEFVDELIEAVVLQRTMSDPSTSLLCISMMGDVEAGKVAQLIAERGSSNEVFKMYMSQMSKADLVHGTKEGSIIETISLI